MVRKAPASRIVVEKTFRTQQKAREWAKEQRKKFRQAGIRKRFDVVQKSGGAWEVVSHTFIEPIGG